MNDIMNAECSLCALSVGRRGITLVELLVTISIIGILVAALAFTYKNWIGGYTIESEMKQIHADLMNARTGAMGRQRDFFVTFAADGTSYSVYEDTNPTPDGNGALEANADRLVLTRNILTHPVTWGGGMITFDGRGLINPNSGAIVATSSTAAATTENPDNDCILFADLKMNIGQWNVATAACTVK